MNARYRTTRLSPRGALVATIAILTSVACVTERVATPEGVASFRVEVAGISEWVDRPAECPDDFGTEQCRRLFPQEGESVTLRVKAVALGHDGEVFEGFSGTAIIDARPARIEGVGPLGAQMQFLNGQSEEKELSIFHAHGAARVWVEHCGSAKEMGTFATGISRPIWFEEPTIPQINATIDNTTSPLVPRADNACAIGGDPRFGLGKDEDSKAVLVGLSHAGSVNAPPPAIGSYLEIIGCSADEHAARVGQGLSCERGPLIVTGVANEGFFFTDIHPDSVASGFNSLYAFTFNYPDGMSVGDLLTSVRGAPVEFTGTTQLQNPIWTRDGVGRGMHLIPEPITIEAADYRAAVRTYGRNESEVMTLERLEGSIVCMDNLAPASVAVNCDRNKSGGIQRRGCLLSGFNEPLPPLCGNGMGVASAPPACNASSERPFCIPLSEAELTECGLQGYVPSNPGEYCCERICYNRIACTEESSLINFGQWSAEVNGNYERADADPVKIAVVSRDADPTFKPLEWGAEQLAVTDSNSRKHLRIVGHLRQVLAARPTWVIITRSQSDIGKGPEDGLCPRTTPTP